MPRCIDCGNTNVLASSKTSREEETSNPPVFGLMANFDQNGYLLTIECQGSTIDEAQEVFENPKEYLDSCPVCGSNNILWKN